MDLEHSTMEAIEQHARQDYPREACGLVYVRNGRQRYARTTNAAAGDEHFKIPANEYALVEDMGEIVAVVHNRVQKALRSPEPGSRPQVFRGPSFPEKVKRKSWDTTLELQDVSGSHVAGTVVKLQRDGPAHGRPRGVLSRNLAAPPVF
jgi:hypothetical protein